VPWVLATALEATPKFLWKLLRSFGDQSCPVSKTAVDVDEESGPLRERRDRRGLSLSRKNKRFAVGNV
jgi:hypothetical protein